MKSDVLNHMKHVVGAQKVLVWLFGGSWKKWWIFPKEVLCPEVNAVGDP